MDPVTYILERGASSQRNALYVEDVFSIFGYSGIPSGQTINNGIDFVNGQGLLWTKNIANLEEAFVLNENNSLIDTVRGDTQAIFTNSNSGQVSLNSIGASPVTFTTSGYSLASGGLVRLNYWNAGVGSGNSYVSYAFKKASKFFDLVTYTGNGTTQVIPHSLNDTPGFIAVKNIGASGDWICWHQGIVSGANRVQVLNSSGATATGAGVWPWNNTLPTTTGFSVGFSGFTTSGQSTNTSGNVYVAYLFANDAGGFGDSGSESIIKCGTYTGVSGTNTVVDVGWEPQFLMIKCIDVSSAAANSSWVICDNINGMVVNPSRNANFFANAIIGGVANQVYPASSGFIISSTGTSVNTNGLLYGYVAIRRGLMKTPTDATTVFDPELQASGNTRFTKNFTCDVDMLLALPRSNPALNGLHSRVAGPGYPLSTNSTLPVSDEIASGAGPAAMSASNFRIKKGLVIGQDAIASGRIQANNASGWVHYAFARARGFFDMALYIGNGTTNRTITHNLGVKPELIISKALAANINWGVYASPLTAASGLLLNTADPALIGTSYWAGTEPTSTSFTVGSGFEVNRNGDFYINYLFSSCPGVSQIGSYTGNATTNQINCGFTNGAKFVLIKRFDAVGDWFVWDSARGIASGNDPYYRLNQQSGEVNGTDYIDPYVSGFEISNTAPSGINASGGKYLFFAIA